MRRTHRWIAAATLAVGISPFLAPDARAQERRFGVEATVGYHLPGGDDFEAFDAAIGFEALGSYAFDRGLELGLGAGIASYDLDGAFAESADITSVFGEGRYRFGVPAAETPHLHPFVAGRLGWSRIAVDATGPGDDPSATGLLFGAGGGVEYWFSDLVAVVGAGTIDILNFGDSDDLPDLGGHRLSIRAGLKVRF